MCVNRMEQAAPLVSKIVVMDHRGFKVLLNDLVGLEAILRAAIENLAKFCVYVTCLSTQRARRFRIH